MQLGWIIAFIPSIIAQLNETERNLFQRYNWWSIVLSIFLILGVTVAVGYDSVQNYSVAIAAYTAVGLVLSTTAVNQLIYSSIKAREAAAAGFLLISMVFVGCKSTHSPYPTTKTIFTSPSYPAYVIFQALD